MTRPQGSMQPGRGLDLLLAGVLVLACGSASVWLGQDVNSDLFNYHFYIGYAFVHGRFDRDLAPAGLGSYLNPLLDGVHYLGIAHLPPRLFGFLLGALDGLSPVLVFLIALRVLGRSHGGRMLAWLAALLAATGPSALSLLGTTFGDTLVSVPALLALLMLLGGEATATGTTGSVSGARVFAAAFLGGAATGLKLTMAPYQVALGGLVLFMAWDRRAPAPAALAFVPGSVLGFLATAGYWCAWLWAHFDNPLFPFANHIFRSPYLASRALRDLRWAARDALDYLTPPFDMALGATSRLQELGFRDARFLLVLLAGLAWLGLRLARRRPGLPPQQRELLGYFLVAYATWLTAFYYYRYAAALEFLAPVVLFVLVRAAFPRAAPPTLLAASAFLLLFSSVGSWGRLPWPETWFPVKLPPQAREADTIVLVVGHNISFVIPYFPQETRFVGLTHGGSSLFDGLVSEHLASHRGNLKLLAPVGQGRENLERFGLATLGDCAIIRTGRRGRFHLCRVVRSP